MRRVLTAAVLVGSLFAGAAAADDAAKKALKEMEGTYALKSMTQGGQPAPDEVFKSFKEMVLKGDTITTRWDDQEDSGKLTLDPAKKPAHVDLEPTTGAEQGVVLRGIYKFEKGTLTLAFAGMGGERPKDFESRDETQVVIVFRKREKK